MNLKHSLTLIATLLLVSLATLSAAEAPAHGRKPSILHIHADDHRPDGLHALGNPLIVTPNLDTLVERGVGLSPGLVPDLRGIRRGEEPR